MIGGQSYLNGSVEWVIIFVFSFFRKLFKLLGV